MKSNSRECSRRWCNLTKVHHRSWRRAWLASDHRQECWCTGSLFCCQPWEKLLWCDLVQSQSLAGGRKIENLLLWLFIPRASPIPLSLPLPFSSPPCPSFLFLPSPSSLVSYFHCLQHGLCFKRWKARSERSGEYSGTPLFWNADTSFQQTYCSINMH